MKPIAYSCSYLAATLMSLSFLFGLLHLPGYEYLCIAGISFILFSSLLHLVIIVLHQNQFQRINLIRLVSGNTGLILVTLGGLSKVLHWPIANVLLLPGIILLLLLFFPLFFLHTYKTSLSKAPINMD